MNGWGCAVLVLGWFGLSVLGIHFFYRLFRADPTAPQTFPAALKTKCPRNAGAFLFYFFSSLNESVMRCSLGSKRLIVNL